MSAPAAAVTPATAATSASTPAIAVLLAATCLSGAAALMWETLWTRALSLILGSTIEAAAATFAAFLVGLALGAWLPTRWRWPQARLGLLYAAVEAAIAVTAWLVAYALHDHAQALAAVLGTRWELLPRALLCFGVALGLVVVPTQLMGITFPLMVSLARKLGGSTLSIGRVYAGNVAGASIGCVVAGFWSLRELGLAGTMALAAALNLGSAALALWLARSETAAPDAEAMTGGAASGPAAAAPASAIAWGGRPPDAALLTLALASGLLVLGSEMLWTRLAGFFLGNRTYAISTLLACVLALLAAGSWLAERLLRRLAHRVFEVAAALVAAAVVGTALSPVLAMRWIAVQPEVEASWPMVADLGLLYRALEAAALLTPMMLPLGTLFPLALVASRRTEDAASQAAGTFYLVNTFGAVVGALGVGFWGFAAIGSVGVAFGLVLLAATLALALAALALREGRRGAAWVLVAAAVAGPALAVGGLPPTLQRVAPHEELLLRREDQTGVLQLVRRPDGQLAVRLNATELIFHLGDLSTSYVQQMQGHLGALFRPDAKTALVLGSGYGITAGALAAHEDLTRIDAVEIVPGLVEAQALFAPYNLDAHRDPRVIMHIDDGRHFVARGGRWDIISINVSDPHLPGGAALFHREFLTLAAAHLQPGGVVLLHAFGADTAVVLATLRSVFPHIRLMRAYDNGFNAIASLQPLTIDRPAVERALARPRLRHALAMAGVLPPVDPVALFEGLWRLEDLPDLVPAGTPIASDDRPIIEFAAGGPAARMLFINE